MSTLGDKHGGRTQRVEYQDFTGGLNTTTPEAKLEANELAEAINVELDRESNMLKTVDGTQTLYESSERNFTDTVYDRINEVLLVVSDENGERQLGYFNGEYVVFVGEINGSKQIVSAEWEDGVLFASGSKLQYFRPTGLASPKYELIEIATSPAVCNGVFTRKGRVVVFFGDELHYSAVGDETNWTETSGDDSSAKWLQIGYKDGGEIIAVGNLYDSIVIFKTNKHAYRLDGDYPDWQVTELGRTISCLNALSVVELKNDLRVLGSGELVAIQPTDEYGDMKAQGISAKVEKLIALLPSTTKVRYVQALEQIWLLNGSLQFLILDVPHNAFFERRMNEEVIDVVATPFCVYVIRQHAITKLTNRLMYDMGEPLLWHISTKALISYNNYVIKRGRADITPHFTVYNEILFMVGNVVLECNMPYWAQFVYKDTTQVFLSTRKLHGSKKRDRTYEWGQKIYHNKRYIYQDPDYVCSEGVIRTELRFVDREKVVRVSGHGSGGSLYINLISFDIAEV